MWQVGYQHKAGCVGRGRSGIRHLVAVCMAVEDGNRPTSPITGTNAQGHDGASTITDVGMPIFVGVRGPSVCIPNATRVEAREA